MLRCWVAAVLSCALLLPACGGAAKKKKDDADLPPLPTVTGAAPLALPVGVPVPDAAFAVNGTEFGEPGQGSVQFIALSGTPFNAGTQAATPAFPANVISETEIRTAGAWLIANATGNVPARIRIEGADGRTAVSAAALITFVVSPVISGPVRFTDTNQSSSVDPGDTLDVAFDQDVALSNPVPGDFALTGAGGSLGAATFGMGPNGNNEVRITLGPGAAFTVQNTPGSRLDLQVGQTGIVSALAAVPGSPTTAADIVPAFLPGPVLGAADTRAIAAGDLNADGRTDLVSGNLGRNIVWRQDMAAQPGRGFAALPSPPAGGVNLNDTRGVAISEVDGAGAIDFLAGNATPPGMLGSAGNRTWLQAPFDVFSDSGANAGQGIGTADTRALLLTDVNGDGFLDIVSGNAGADEVHTHNALGAGLGGFGLVAYQSLGSATTNALAVGDVDGAGGLDLLAGNAGANQLYLHDGAAAPFGMFGPAVQSLGTGDTRAVAFGNLNGDAFDDIVEANGGAGANRVYLNNAVGPGLWFGGPTPQSLGLGDSRAVVLGDIDLDGLDDVVIGNAGGQPNVVWLNRANGTSFLDTGQRLGLVTTQALVLDDLDGDGDLDLVSGNDGANQVWWGSAATP